MKLQYIVTGTGRCGSLNFARNLTKAGIHCGHESIFNLQELEGAKKRLKGELIIEASKISTTLKGKPLWFDPLQLKADSSYMAAPFLDDEILKETKIIHLIRHPLSVISSFVKNLGYFGQEYESPWEKFMYKYLPSIKNFNDPLDRACEYYIKWNKMIAKFNTIVHKIEDDPNELFEKLQLRKIEHLTDERNTFNSRDKDFCLDDLSPEFRKKIKNFMAHHGY